MKRLRGIFCFLLCLFTVSAYGQSDDRLAVIERRLDSLAVRDTLYLAEVDVSVGKMPLAELLRSVAKVNALSISVKGAGDLVVTCNFNRARVVDLLYFLCKEYTLDLEVIGNIVSIWPYAKTPAPPPEPKVVYYPNDTTLSYDLIAASLTEVARRITDSCGVNLIVPQSLYGQRVSGYVARMPFAEAIFTLASTNGLEASCDKSGRTWTFEALPVDDKASASPSPYRRRMTYGSSQLAIDSLGRITASIGRGNVYDILLDVCEELHLDYFFIAPPNVQTGIFVKDVDVETLFDVLFTGTPYTYYVEEGIYMFGEAKDEKVFSTKVIPMVYRTVDNLTEIIPDNLKKKIQVTAFPDLNSMICSGDQRAVSRIEHFLKSIDKTVPLITIEVMIVDASKEVMLEAGLGLGVGTKPTKTTATFSPGVEMTLGAEAINNVLDATGIVRLGRVTENFYANLKMMDDNGTIDLRSTPKLSTLNGHVATLSSGEMQYYKETNNTYMGTQNPVQSTSYVWKNVEANMTLSILPYVSQDGHITMTVELTQSEFTSRTEAEAPPGTTTRSFKSMIRVQNGETVLLGGIDRNSHEKSSQGLPFIARVPVLRWIFGKHKNSRQDRRLNVFIKPTVIY